MRACEDCFWCEKGKRGWRFCTVHCLSWHGIQNNPVGLYGPCGEWMSVDDGVKGCPFKEGFGAIEMEHGPCNEGCRVNGKCSAP